MKTLVIVLTLISVALPLWGLANLYRLSSREARALREAPGATTRPSTTAGEFGVLINVVKTWVRDRPRSIRADFFLIGGGVVAGGLANILGVLCL